MYRPPMPPQGMRPPGGPSPGPYPPSGLPPPQRPPAGYRPSFSGGNIPSPGGPPPGLMGPSNASLGKPPVQMMSNLSLDNSQQFLSNGISDVNVSHSHHSIFNGNQSTETATSQIHSSVSNTDTTYSTPISNASSDFLQNQNIFANSQSPNLMQDKLNSEDSSTATSNNVSMPFSSDSYRPGMPPTSFSRTTPSPGSISSSPLGMYPQNKPGTYSTSTMNSAAHQPEISTSANLSDTQLGGMHGSRQDVPSQGSFDEFNNLRPEESSQHSAQPPSLQASSFQPGLPPTSVPHTGPQSQPGMSSFSPAMAPTPQSGMASFSPAMAPPPQSGMPSFSSAMAPPPQPGMPSFSSAMAPPPQPGMPTFNSSMAQPPQPSTPSYGSAMGPASQPGMPPLNSPLGGVPPSRPGMPPYNSPIGGPPRPGMPPTFSGVSPASSHMGPPKLGMPPVNSQMGSPMLGMPPMNPQMGPPKLGMPPLTSQMGPPKPGMSPSDSQIGSPRFGMPPGSGMISPQSDTHAQRPGIPPPPSTGSYLSGQSSGLPPQQPGSQMGPGPHSGIPPGSHSGMPPASSNMGQLSAPGGMQNRYPGAGSASSPMGGYPQGNQGRRLNPDDMPSPLQVMDEDKQCKSGEFITNMKGAVPPLVTTDFVVKDGGNASPRFIRSTMYSIPATQDMMKQSSVPFGLVISPFAELNPEEAPIYMGTSLANGPVRCNRCKGYMSPLMMFMDGGRRFQCLLCKQINEVPADYYCHMDSQGARADKFQRPELCLGTYEFAATAEYCKDKLLPKEPAFIFVFEMSQMMVQRGIINLLCQNMKSILQHLPKEEISGQEGTKSSIRVGFITYDSSVHFYKLTGLAPEMCIVCDKETMFVPVPDGVLCDVEEVADNIDKLMECIPQNFQTSKETSGSLSCAIQAGMAALKASGRAGKLFVFHSSLPQFEGPGKLKNRDDRKLLGTEKEKTVLTPQNTHYNNLAQDLVGVGCGVDFYSFNEGYVDLATIGQVARLTGGQCFKYTFFQPNKDAERLFDDLRLNISRNIAFDSVMRVRTSTGVRPVEFFGHFFMSNTHDVELSVLDSGKAIALEVKHDDKITEEDGVYIQVALLYTSVRGQRKLRILNMALNICTQMADLYKNCDLDTLMNFFGKQSIFKFLDTSAKQVRENLVARAAQILACYRKNCASPSSAGQLILPELMKLLPLYINCLSKCDALSGGHDMTCDDRSWHIYQLSTMNVESSVVYFYPRLIPLTDIDTQDGEIPSAVRTSYEKLSQDGAYLLENGLFMFMWVGSGTSPTWMKDVFGVSAPHQLDPVLSELPEIDNPVSKQVRGIINAIREQRRLHVRLYVVPQQGKHEVVMRNYLVEDKGVYGAPSYVDFLCHVHKEIRALLS